MWPVTKRQDELSSDEQGARVPKDDEEDVADTVAERVNEWIRETSGNEVECQVEVGEGEVGEEELDELVDGLDVEEDLAGDGVVGSEDLAEVEEGVDGCEEGTVEPSSTLRNKLRDGIC